MQSGLVLLLAGMEALGEWMARGGDDAVFTQEVVSALGASADLEVDVWTKSADDTGPGTKVVESTDWSAISGTGFKTVEVNGELQDLVRFKFKAVNGTGVLFRMLSVTWFARAHV